MDGTVDNEYIRIARCMECGRQIVIRSEATVMPAHLRWQTNPSAGLCPGVDKPWVPDSDKMLDKDNNPVPVEEVAPAVSPPPVITNEQRYKLALQVLVGNLRGPGGIDMRPMGYEMCQRLAGYGQKILDGMSHEEAAK